MTRAVLSALTFVLASASAVAQHSDWPKYCGNLEMTGVAPSGGPISVATPQTTFDALVIAPISHTNGVVFTTAGNMPMRSMPKAAIRSGRPRPRQPASAASPADWLCPVRVHTSLRVLYS